MHMHAEFTSTSELPFASLERVLVLNVSYENDLFFMRMNVQVTYIFIPIVSHRDSFCHRGKSKLGIGLFIHELLREPLILIGTKLILAPGRPKININRDVQFLNRSRYFYGGHESIDVIILAILKPQMGWE